VKIRPKKTHLQREIIHPPPTNCQIFLTIKTAQGIGTPARRAVPERRWLSEGETTREKEWSAVSAKVWKARPPEERSEAGGCAQNI
jgi:hypothetical protein